MPPGIQRRAPFSLRSQFLNYYPLRGERSAGVGERKARAYTTVTMCPRGTLINKDNINKFPESLNTGGNHYLYVPSPLLGYG
jgi:hypothetical protein